MRTNGTRSRVVRLVAVPLMAVTVAAGAAGCVDVAEEDDDEVEQEEDD